MGTVVLNGPVSGTTNRQRLAESLRELVQEGIRIKTQKVWSAAILQEARQLKLDWSRRVTELLEPIGEEWAAPFNSWRGQLLPERAELRLFVEQFLSEMDHRVRELEGTIDRLMSLEPLEVVPVQPVPYRDVEAQTGETSLEASEMAVLESGNETLAEMEDLLEDRPLGAPAPATAPARPPKSESMAGGGLLIVHHSDPATEQKLEEYMQRLGFTLTVVRRPVNEGATGEKLPHTQSFAFALVLSGAAGGEAQHPRTLFELGYCAGRFGPERVCVIHPESSAGTFRDECDLPHVPLDRADGWQLQIARQLKHSGIELDLNRLY